MYTAQLPDKGTFVIRYPRGKGKLKDWRCPLEAIEVGTGRCLKEGDNVALITLGPIGKKMEEAIKQAEEKGISVAHYDLRFLKPLDSKMLNAIGQKFDKIITVEDGVIAGGMGSAIMEFMASNGYTPIIKTIGIPDIFVEHGTVDELYKLCKMDCNAVYQAILEISQNNK
jgi:1-deoxy-D-xylulose-5-phosphate synthase